MSDKDELEKMSEGSEDSGDLSDSGDEADSQMTAEIDALKSQLSDNPYDYDKYIGIIGLLSKAGELDDLRKFRRKFSEHFPLAPKIWLAWLSDENKLAATNDEKEALGELFEKAVKDYVSVDIWLEYCQFSLWQMGQPDAYQKIRNVLERSLVAAGVDVAHGALLWETYREFEMAILAGNPDNADQKARLDKLFRRQLAVPLTNMITTMGEYKEWLKEKIDPNVERNFKTASELLQKRQVLEDRLEQTHQESAKMTVYQEYIDIELKEGNPVRIKSIYERRLTEHCLTPQFWIDYAEYLETQLNDLENCHQILERAVRNCPWHGGLWVKILRCGEKLNQPKVEMCKHLETALVSGLSTTEDFREVWLAFIDYRRRSLTFDEDDECPQREKDDLKEVFRKALEHLANMNGDPECKIARYWASVEADRFRDMEEARQIWAQITMGPAGEKAKFWLEYIHLEKMFGDSKHLKKLFPKALSRTQDNPYKIGEMWIQFEREEGTLESFEKTEKEVKLKLADFSQKNVQESRPLRDTNRNQPKENRKRRPHENGSNEEPVFKKPFMPQRNRPENKQPQPSSSKRPDSKVEPPPGFNAKKSKIDHDIPPGFNDKKKTPMDIEPPPGFSGKKSDKDIEPPPGFKPPTSDHQDSVDETKVTVFVSNLDYQTTKDEIQNVLSSSGEIEEVRLVTNPNGKSKGFAYVKFQNAEAAKNAIGRDREPIKGRPMYISECKPDKSSRSNHFRYKNDLEEHKLFVKGLPQTITKEALGKLFSPYGNLKDVRLVTFRNGHAKGHAYVEYENAADAKKAVMKLDNYDYEGHILFVAISNPPARKDSGMPIKSLGGGEGPNATAGPRGRGRTQVAFVPRVLQQSKPTASTSASNGSSKMSNSDFRSMLLGEKKS